ncbi:histone methylation protein DOT1-domain-containing protein [Coniella lustricola]|uniref:Histone-lysine N-methyltransferase, H3 lysine-79 specific n=1 Tax=Coniella lustricola TaxID=2025994 RepID=A0A2T3AK81_9PEZI|nr:histone methylation protein DOT1-domain-containing protein [Coniella lustricola]
MFSNQRRFTPKTLPKPQVKVRTVIEKSAPANPHSKPRTPLSGGSSRATSTSKTTSRPSSTGFKRSISGRARSSNSPFASSSSADDRNYLALPSTSSRNKRIRSPTTDSETRITFDASDGEDNDDDWENRLKRRKHTRRTDPDRRIPSTALEKLADHDYDEKSAKTLKFVNAADVVSLALGDLKSFPEASNEESVVELQYPGSFTRERFELVNQRDKLDVIKDIIKVVKNVKETYITDEDVKKDLGIVIRKLERNSNDRILDIGAFRAAVDDYNRIILKQLKSGAILKHLKRQHDLSDDLVTHILQQVYDRVVTPNVDRLRRYTNGTDNIYGEMKHNFITKVLCTDLQMTSKQTFVDLGSGVGNVVLQAALQIGCESWGCEVMEDASKLAKEQHIEFEARCKLWGIQPGKVRIIKDDFLNNHDIGEVIKRANVVLANNQAFTPDLTESLKIKFLDLTKGCKIVSLKKFPTSSKYNENDIASSILSEPECHRWPENGVSWTDSTGDYHITTKIEGGQEF